ncbi:MAG: HTH domain-containing protein [Candidatus Babeliales bacterium]
MENLSEADKKALLSSKYVSKITGSQILFTANFKIKAVELNLEGKSPPDIFLALGIDPGYFLSDYPKKSIYRWKKVYLEKGKEALKEETRGKKAKGRPKKKYDPNDMDSVMARLAYLEAENDFLKKLHALADLKEKKNTR